MTNNLLDELEEEENDQFSIIAYAKSKKTLELTGLAVLCFCIGFAGNSTIFLLIQLVSAVILGLGLLFGVQGFFYSIKSILSEGENTSTKWFAFGINLISTAAFIFALLMVLFIINNII